MIFTGCGSTYYLSLAAAGWFQALTGTPAQGVPSSELWLFPELYYREKERSLLVAVSRSGATSETLRAVSAFQARGRGEVLTIQCQPDSPLAQLGRVNLVIPSGRENSVVQTRSFSSMYIAALALGARWGGQRELFDQMPRLLDRGERLIGEVGPRARRWAAELEVDRVYFLGSGPRYGLACEASLKMKEMSLTHSEPLHFLELRHGPKSMVDPRSLVVGLLSDGARPSEEAVLREAAALGARLLVLGEDPSPSAGAITLSLRSDLPEPLRSVLYLPLLQLLAYERAMLKELDPDRPTNLESVVVLEDEGPPARPRARSSSA